MKDYTPYLIVGLIVIALIFSSDILNLFRLDGKDTVYSFYTTDAEA